MLDDVLRRPLIRRTVLAFVVGCAAGWAFVPTSSASATAACGLSQCAGNLDYCYTSGGDPIQCEISPGGMSCKTMMCAVE
jgi:hypothetical protein